jgi:hypothetical protein
MSTSKLLVTLSIPMVFNLSDDASRKDLAVALAKNGVNEIKSSINIQPRMDEAGNIVGNGVLSSLLAVSANGTAVLSTRDVSGNTEEDVDFIGRSAYFCKEYKEVLASVNAKLERKAELEAMSPEDRRAYKEALRLQKAQELAEKRAAKAARKAAREAAEASANAGTKKTEKGKKSE